MVIASRVGTGRMNLEIVNGKVAEVPPPFRIRAIMTKLNEPKTVGVPEMTPVI
jgi:hypothetical protein